MGEHRVTSQGERSTSLRVKLVRISITVRWYQDARRDGRNPSSMGVQWSRLVLSGDVGKSE
eukprot:3847163-Amphidinium_carterae.3